MRQDLIRHQRHRRLKLHVGRSLGEDDPDLHFLIRDPLRHLWPLEERHLQYIPIASLHFPQGVLEVRIPSDAETVLPAPENGVPRLELEVRFLDVAPEAARRDVADVVGEVRVQGSDLQRDFQLLDRARRRVVVLRRRPRYAGELVLEVRAPVGQPVPLLGREVAAPLADLDVPLQQGGVDKRFGELVPYARFLRCACWRVVVGPVGEG